jgi:hypothetical protein
LADGNARSFSYAGHANRDALLPDLDSHHEGRDGLSERGQGPFETVVFHPRHVGAFFPRRRARIRVIEVLNEHFENRKFSSRPGLLHNNRMVNPLPPRSPLGRRSDAPIAKCGLRSDETGCQLG